VASSDVSDPTTIDATRADPATVPGGPARAYLVVREGASAQVIDVDEGNELVLGRSSEATVRLDDPKASREHARVRRREGALTLQDLGSRNGTRLNREVLRNEERPLRSGDVIGIGAAEILVAVEVQRIATTPGEAKALPAPPGVIIADPAMAQVFELVRKVAAAPTTVLILGETGVGKEVVAEQLHLQSPRAKKPFVRLNCGSLPENLLESELFGYEKGAFTGADKRKQGYLEAADGGTLFLDEIGELAPQLQSKLLRVLESRRFMRVGGTQEIAADVRIVAATNRDLEAESKSGGFREDLYFRLSAFVIAVPPLRERQGEVVLLAELFARQLSQKMGTAAPLLAPDAIAALSRYRWPGNVRELRNAIERALVLAEGGALKAEHLPEAVRKNDGPSPKGAMREQLADLELKAIEDAMAAEKGNQTRAAKRLGISRRALIYKLEKYGLKT
jgi:transcriptional regulator with PAS, ATPase and Fis domain